jgi:tetratricopeptide (TPR) repeat protein
MDKTTSAGRPPQSPYRGIRPYRYRDRDVFFAREAETRKLIRLIVLYRGTLLYSDSGTGKSSLINAGIIPAARAEGLQPERIRVQPIRGQEIVVERIGEGANGQLVFLSSVLTNDDQANRAVLSVEDLPQRLQDLAPGIRPLLIFDQFEEWCTLFEEGAAKYGVEEVRTTQKHILDLMAWLMEREQLPVKVLIAFREDHLAKLDPLFKRCPRLPEHYLRLTALSGDQIYRVIRGPFEKDGPVVYRPELSIPLAKEIQRQFEARSAGTDVQLTEVQIVCDALLQAGPQASDPEAYFAGAGGVQGILEQYLESAIAALDRDQQKPALALLGRMVTSAGTRNVISEGDLLSQVEKEDDIPRAVLRGTLKSLDEKTRLIRHERRRDVYCYEIASEFLVPWIGKKAEAHQAVLEQKKLLEAQYAAEREQQRRKLLKAVVRSRQLVRALLALACVAVVTAVVAFGLARYAQQAHAEAREALKREKVARDDVQRQANSWKAVLDSIVGDLASASRRGISDEPMSRRDLLNLITGTLENTFIADPLTAAPIRELLGLAYLEVGSYGPAERDLKRSLDIRTERLGEENRDTLGNMSSLGLFYVKSGRYEDAERLFRKALAIGRRTLRRDDPYFLNFLLNLADVCARQNRPEEAKRLYSEGLDAGAPTARDNEDHTARFLSPLVRLCVATKDFKSLTEPLKSAKELDLSDSLITDADLQSLGSLGSLRRLVLLNTHVTDGGLACLKDMRSLESLDLQKTQVTDAGLKYLTDLPGLKSLDLRRTRISDAGLERVGQLKSLEHLWLGETAVSDAGVASLKHLTGLQELCLHETKVGDPALTSLQGLSQLQSLCLSDTQVGDAGLSHLGGLQELQSLFLRRTRITNAGLEHLAPLHALERLDLSGTQIDDDGLDRLRPLQALKRLYLDTTRVTWTGVDTLERSLPVCDITGP